MAKHWFIERLDIPGPAFYSEKIGRDNGAPGAGYSSDIALATRYETEAAAWAGVEKLGWFSGNCKVERHAVPDPVDSGAQHADD